MKSHCMTTKLTLSIDSDIIKKAKRISHKRGVSISRMVEQFLQNIPDNNAVAGSSVKKLRGIGGSPKAGLNWKKVKAEKLGKKYGV